MEEITNVARLGDTVRRVGQLQEHIVKEVKSVLYNGNLCYFYKFDGIEGYASASDFEVEKRGLFFIKRREDSFEVECERLLKEKGTALGTIEYSKKVKKIRKKGIVSKITGNRFFTNKGFFCLAIVLLLIHPLLKSPGTLGILFGMIISYFIIGALLILAIMFVVRLIKSSWYSS